MRLNFNRPKKERKKTYLEELENKDSSWKPSNEIIKEWEDYFDTIFGNAANQIKDKKKEVK